MSVQTVPIGAAENTQPATGLQLSTVHAFPSLQTRVAIPVQPPLEQKSPIVQALPSLQFALLFTYPHAPVATSQVSVVHTLLSLQFFGVPAAQVPAAQTSLRVQGFPSSHAAVLLTKPQPVVAEQNGVVHGLLSSGHVMEVPAHTPLVQTSLVVQGELSLHEVPVAAGV